jgi:putative inorganic carbon (hco3(-)) transporter
VGAGHLPICLCALPEGKEKTIISTNYGDMGNAHSEYIGPLSESGVLGMLTFLGIVITSVLTGIRIYRRSQDKHIKIIGLMMTLGLITYYVHGLMNNFLDTDKASVPFWGFTAIIVAIDLYHTSRQSAVSSQQS